MAVVLAVISVWLIVTRNSVTGQRIGALAGFWGLLLGASALSVGRRTPQPEPVATPEPSDVPAPGVDLELRSSVALERAAEADARRDFEVRLTSRLEGMLRQEVAQSVGHEIAQSVGRELHALRTEIASLRSELVEKVGGQLRLERIETTRVIGSDLEALQHEVRQLKDARDAMAFADFGPTRTFGTTRAVIESVPEPVAPEPVREPVPVPEPASPIEPVAAPARVDDFASLPRLTPFTDLEFDLIDAAAQSAYRGRRRASDDPIADPIPDPIPDPMPDPIPEPIPQPAPEPPPRHMSAAVQQTPTTRRRHGHADADEETAKIDDSGRNDATATYVTDDGPSGYGGRAHGSHVDDGAGHGNDLLARLLQREGAR